MKVFTYWEDELKQYILECAKNCPESVDVSTLVRLIVDGSTNDIDTPSRYHGVIGTKFVSISDIGMDFLAFIMCNGSADYIVYCASNQSFVAPSAGLAMGLAYFIYSELKKVVQLRGDEYCIYKQAVTHFRRHEEFSLLDMIEWLPDQNRNCNMHNDKLYCRYRDDDFCILRCQKEKVLDTMQMMVDKGILKSGKNKNTFRLNY